MTNASHQPFARNLFLGILAVAGTFASFAVTTSPAAAQASQQRGYSATLATPLEAPARKVVNGVAWNCTGAACAGPIDGSSPKNSCARVARSFGQLTRFATPKGEFSAEDLARCNAAA
jgi:hypothetical protein